MKVIITGGAGFIGTNVALAHLSDNDKVVIIDNLSRRGTSLNRDLILKKAPRGRAEFHRADIRDFRRIKKILSLNKDAALVYHLAAQVAVTTSVVNPREDFEINALGTFNLLEAVRTLKIKAPVLYSSTNKVYGGMEKERLILRRGTGWHLADYPSGISEDYPADFHSPYGCSKGAADQYVRDYSRIYGLKTVVFRQSCIYGINQYGMEDQGWIVHFIIRTLIEKKPIFIYGDGNQVRDALYIDDLVRIYRLAYRNINKVSGEIINVGGGPSNAISIINFVRLLEDEKIAGKIKVKFATWRPGDQKVFISDNSKAGRLLGWKPEIPLKEGIKKTLAWVGGNIETIKKAYS